MENNIITNINFDGLTIPAIPLLWYREDHIFSPPESIKHINSDTINYLWPNNNLEINNDYCYWIVQKNILTNPNLYISFHTLSFYLDTKKTSIDCNFNKSYKWDCLTYSTDSNIIFFNGSNSLKNNNWCTGNAFIHNNSFSPPGDFKFSIKESTEKTFIIIHGKCLELNINVTCLFEIINNIN